MAAVIVRVQTQNQLEECLNIRKEVFVEEQQVPLELEIDEYDRIGPDVHHVLVDVGDEYAATGRMIYYHDNAAKMQRIAVRKSYRSHGIGKILLIAMEELARELGLTESVLDAQCQAEPFYRKLGYETISTEPFDDAGIPHVRMVKSLRNV
ncbi:Predicted N-acyltransferase, GNAT family [Fontibacillus panacisegetis]|uniref:Predicted N-acyltransferase, GNAT family n=1 Tax=Fontibacillus panacisegetis TaxID=670482 RepID=A0A1G7I0E8_9BACL|nr:GNAT family N-acetyltransferase [Fontibacillus panacisegetis]SDF05834.1 Predicted N-acyltransferase, GNAT family [Fontibacillus panacisegetis]